jgi:hypothetical protein
VGEPPEWAEVYRFLPIVRPVKRGDWRREAAARGFKWNAGNADTAGRISDAEGRPPSESEAENTRLPPGSPRLAAPKPGNGR